MASFNLCMLHFSLNLLALIKKIKYSIFCVKACVKADSGHLQECSNPIQATCKNVAIQSAR